VEPPTHVARDLGALTRESLKAPLASPDLATLAREAKTVVVAIPDATRPAVAKHLLPAVFSELLAAGIAPGNIAIFIAAGVHPTVTADIEREIVGDGVPPEVKIVQNDCRRAENFRKLGTTRRGTPININRLLTEADLKVVIGTVGFHYFAGMGGGRKMIVPGACTYETVRVNHSLTLTDDGDLHPACRSGVLEGNPVHEDMVEGMQFLKRIFMVNIVLDGWGEIADVVAGDAVQSHLEAARRAKELLEAPVGRRCDLAVAGAGSHPLDINLIQTHKSIDHAAESVRDGGVVVAVAECSGGVGSDTFLPWFGIGDSKAVSRNLKSDYQLNGQTALSLLKKLERLKIILVSSLDRALIERTGMIPAEDIDEALGLAARYVGEDPLTYVFPTAWGILPVAQETQ
jgi:nickel-dependent lactate racemase